MKPKKNITYCINNNCNKRNLCNRAIEKYEKDDYKYFSFADFKCIDATKR